MDVNCYRCRKRLNEGDNARLVRRWAEPSGTLADGRAYFLDGATICKDSYYHERCLPPVLFHKLAGSRPAEQSPAAMSLGNEHVAGGGMSRTRRPNRRRHRLPRRQRYLATTKRKQLETAEREKQQHERTMTMTAADVLGRGGHLGLCKCRTFSSQQDYFVTPHGYCRYCGKWQPEVLREHLGQTALDAAIDELSIHDRTRMRELVT